MRMITPLIALVIASALGLGWLSPAPVAGASEPPANGNYDPLEGFNRKIFWFNDQVDTYMLVPVAKGWNTIAPTRVKTCLSNFFQNLRFPIVAGNNLLQAKPVATLSDIGRFLVNTTVGLAGFFDPATGMGLEQHNEDLGQTLGYWGMPPGPYLVLPFFGPSNPRDTVGLAGDSFSWVYPYFIDWIYTFSATGTDVVNARALALRDVERIKEASVDYYAAVRNGYQQRRDNLVHDRKGMSEEEQQDLYNVESNGGE
ncbi:MAG: VacJ family lipoprotein [Deltaproteobacteria bacterium]|nr:VacJ family lipoprotein [Deltaproteobacteria bacterium]